MKGVFKFWGLFLVAAFPLASAVEWEKISPYPTLANLRSAVQGNGALVIAGDTAIIYSVDSGATWAEGTGIDQDAVRNVGNRITDVEFGNGRFVATTRSGSVLVSTNGQAWTPHVALAGNFLNSIVFGHGLFAAGGANGNILTSADGISWNVITGISTVELNLSAFANSRFLFMEFIRSGSGAGTTLGCVTSADGVSWTRAPSAGIYGQYCQPGDPCSTQIYAMGLVAVTNTFYLRASIFSSLFNPDRKYYASGDGVNWTNIGAVPFRENPPTAAPRPPNDLFFCNGTFLEFGTANTMASPDLNTWTRYLTAGVSAAGFDGTNYFEMGLNGSLYRGPTLTNLLRLDNLEKSIDLVSVAAHGGAIVGVANLHHNTTNDWVRPAIVTSTNGGRNFFRPANLTPPALSSVWYASNLFVAVGAAGSIYRSPDGLAWTNSTPVTTSDLMDLAYGGDEWTAVGRAGKILTSTDGALFTAQTSGTDIDLYGVVEGGGTWVAVGASGALLRRTGSTWSLSGTDEGSTLWSVAYGNGVFVATGDNGRVYVSADGSAWTPKRIIGADSLARVAFAHGQFLTISYRSGKSYLSTDGLTWTQTTFPGVFLQGVDVSENQFYLSGIPNETFINSTDLGTVIIREQSAPPFTLTASLSPDGHFQLDTTGQPLGNFRVYSTSDAATLLWTPRDLLPAGPAATWIDPEPLTDRRFYRVGPE